MMKYSTGDSMRLLFLSAVGWVMLVSAATAQDAGALDRLRSQPASLFSIGMLNVEGSLDAIENRMWDYTYDLTGYSDDDDGYGFLFPNINYRYGFAYVDEDTGILFLTGVTLAQGKFLEKQVCQAVIVEMRHALFASSKSDLTIEQQARSYLRRMFPATVAGGDNDDTLISGLLNEVMLEVRMYENLPTGQPDTLCIGFLDRDMVSLASVAF